LAFDTFLDTRDGSVEVVYEFVLVGVGVLMVNGQRGIAAEDGELVDGDTENRNER
jgi:hypothetical protein